MSALLPILLTVVVFMLTGAIFVAAETALITLRDAQIKRIEETRGRRGAQLARLVENPNRFLAAGQVGVTLTGFLSAAYGEKRISPIVTPRLEEMGLSAGTAEAISFIGSTVIVAYLALVLAELTPKRLALQHAEKYALLLAGPIDVMAKVFAPFIWLLSKSTNAVVMILGGNPKAGKEQISGEELRGMVAAHEELSVDERELIDDVFEAGERLLREVMIPRTEVAFLDGDLPTFKAVKIVAELPHSRYPVVGESSDDVLGFVHVRDLLDPDMRERSIRLADLARPVLRLPGTKRVIPTLGLLRSEGAHLAIVVDEYGGTAGIVTLEDLVEELVGDIRDEYDQDEPDAVNLQDIDGLLNLGDFLEATGIDLPDGPYETVAGYVAAQLGRIPVVGDQVHYEGHVFTVGAMDGRRISSLRLARG